MKLLKYILFFLTVCLVSCTPRYAKDDIACLQIIDRNGLTETIGTEEKLSKYKNTNFDEPQSYQKVLRIYQKNSLGDVISKLTSYHDNGLVWKSLDIKNARAHGNYREWYPNGTIKVEAFVIGGSADFNMQDDWLFDGICKYYDEKGILLNEFNYQKGFLQGQSKYYYENHNLKKMIPYVNNEIHGEITEYSRDGECIFKINYKNGVKEGPSIGYWSKNNISFIEDYENNLLINGQYFEKSRIKISQIKNGDGQKTVFDNCQISQIIEYKNGRPHGKIQNFSENGLLSNEFFQKDNVKDGTEVVYYTENEVGKFKGKKAIPKLEISWDNGNINGFVKTWYKNGNLESQKQYFQNKKNGSHYAWYENGSVMFIEEYENDSLQKGSYFQIDQKDPSSTIINGNGFASIFDSRGRFIKKISYKNGLPSNDR